MFSNNTIVLAHPANTTTDGRVLVTVPEWQFKIAFREAMARKAAAKTARHAVAVFWHIWSENADLECHRIEIEKALRAIAKAPYRALEGFELAYADSATDEIARHWRAAVYLAHAAWQCRLVGLPCPVRPQEIEDCRIAAYDSKAWPKGGAECPVHDRALTDRYGNVPDRPRDVVAMEESAARVEVTRVRIVRAKYGKRKGEILYEQPIARWDHNAGDDVAYATPSGAWAPTTPEWPAVAALAAFEASPEGAAWLAGWRRKVGLAGTKCWPLTGRFPARLPREAALPAGVILKRAVKSAHIAHPVVCATIRAAREAGAVRDSDARIVARALEELAALVRGRGDWAKEEGVPLDVNARPEPVREPVRRPAPMLGGATGAMTMAEAAAWAHRVARFNELLAVRTARWVVEDAAADKAKAAARNEAARAAISGTASLRTLAKANRKNRK